MTVENNATLKMRENNQELVEIIPPSASPVLKTKVMFKLQDNFPFNLTKEDFTVNITLLELGIGVSPYYKQG